MRYPLIRRCDDVRLSDWFRPDLLFWDLLETDGSGIHPSTAGRSDDPMELFEDEDNIYAECELQGINPRDLEITIIGNELRVNGKWSHEENEPQWNEPCSGSFSQAVRLPVEVVGKKARAEMKNDALTVILPKRKAFPAQRVKILSPRVERGSALRILRSLMDRIRHGWQRICHC